VQLSTRAKGRVERFFATAQDRLVKGLRLSGASTLEAANKHLEETFCLISTAASLIRQPMPPMRTAR
jgi:hypothetical protein